MLAIVALAAAQVTNLSQVHLALGRDATSLTISWAGPTAAEPPAAQVWWGTSPGNLTERTLAAPAETYSLSELQTCNATTCTGGPDECLVHWEPPGWLFHAILATTPGTELYYQLHVTGYVTGYEMSGVLGPVHVGPKPCGGERCLSFVALGDYGAFAGTGEDPKAADANTTRALRAMAGELDVVVRHCAECPSHLLCRAACARCRSLLTPATLAAARRRLGSGGRALVLRSSTWATSPVPSLYLPCTFPAQLHVGDLAYSNEAMTFWREWLDEIAPVASRVPWMVACGNHDCLHRGQEWTPPWAGFMAAGGDGGECAIPFSRRFLMPGEPSRLEAAGWREPLRRCKAPWQ